MQKAAVEGCGPRTPTADDEGPPSPARWSSLNADDAAYGAGVANEGPADWTEVAPAAAAPARGATDLAGHVPIAQGFEEVVCVSVKTCASLRCPLLRI